MFDRVCLPGTPFRFMSFVGARMEEDALQGDTLRLKIQIVTETHKRYTPLFLMAFGDEKTGSGAAGSGPTLHVRSEQPQSGAILLPEACHQ